MCVDPTTITEWMAAEKCKAIMAKPVSSVITDHIVLRHLLLSTIEGEEPIDPTTMFCVAIDSGEAWQQTPVKLLNKYTITSVRFDGWLICTPNKGAVEDAIQVFVKTGETFTIIGKWGKTLPDGTVNVQTGKSGDYLLRSRTDPSDVWIVARALFESTYAIQGNAGLDDPTFIQV